MSLSIDFTGSRVVVVGGTSGINLGIAQAFAEHGADAVSYTHLDVYKRQVQRDAELEVPRGRNRKRSGRRGRLWHAAQA